MDRETNILHQEDLHVQSTYPKEHFTGWRISHPINLITEQLKHDITLLSGKPTILVMEHSQVSEKKLESSQTSRTGGVSLCADTRHVHRDADELHHVTHARRYPVVIARARHTRPGHQHAVLHGLARVVTLHTYGRQTFDVRNARRKVPIAKRPPPLLIRTGPRHVGVCLRQDVFLLDGKR